MEEEEAICKRNAADGTIFSFSVFSTHKEHFGVENVKDMSIAMLLEFLERFPCCKDDVIAEYGDQVLTTKW